MTKPNWKPIQIRLGDLIAWGDNPRQSTKKDAERLLETERKFGQPIPFCVSPYLEESMVNCYDGHQRLNAWKKVYGDSFVIWAFQSDRHLTEDERKDFVLQIHNAHGQWNADILSSWPADTLKGGWFDNDTLKSWKADVTWLGEFLKSEAPAADAEPQTDRAAELLEKWQVQPGDLWLLGEHRLLVGDCTDAGNVARLMDGERAGMMVTDPPYGVEYDPEWRTDAAEKGLIGFSTKRYGKIENDDRADWSEAWNLFDGDVAYCWHASLRASTVEQSFTAAGFEPRSHIVWAKDSFSISRGHYHWQHELCLYVVRKGKTAQWIGDRSQTTLWKINKNDGNDQETHSTQKPLECMQRPIANHNFDIIYEPFAGSGTTLIAAENLSRRCYAMEISPAYCAVILQRFADAFPDCPIRRAE